MAASFYFLKVLHRDVALRNVLLKSDFTIRVADFGLSRRAGEDGCYIQSRNICIPFRYIAPESLRSGRFSPQSESWSFGVVLWEVFTFAQHQPYADEEYSGLKSLNDILDFLDSGKRLHVPDCTPRNVFVANLFHHVDVVYFSKIFSANMMTTLWYEDPSQRPTFRTCQNILCDELLTCNPLVRFFSLPKHVLTLSKIFFVAQCKFLY